MLLAAPGEDAQAVVAELAAAALEGQRRLRRSFRHAGGEQAGRRPAPGLAPTHPTARGAGVRSRPELGGGLHLEAVVQGAQRAAPAPPPARAARHSRVGGCTHPGGDRESSRRCLRRPRPALAWPPRCVGVHHGDREVLPSRSLARARRPGRRRGLTIRLDGRPIAFSLYLQLAGRSYGMNMAFDPAYAQYGPGSEAKLQAIEASWSEGIRRIELLGTAAEHKRRFTDRFEPVYEGIGLAWTLRGRAATEALLAGIRLRARSSGRRLQGGSTTALRWSARASDRRAPSSAARPTVEAFSAPGPHASPRKGSSTASGGCGEAAGSGGAGAARTAAEDRARCTAERSRTTGR